MEEEDPILEDEIDDSLKSMRSLGKPILYKSRWHMLGIYSLLACMNQIVWVCFVAIPSSTSNRFDVNTTSVNFLAMVFPILFFPGLLLSSLTMEKYSLRGTMLIASIMMTTGCIVRFLGVVLPSSEGHESYALILVGQSVVALAQPFVLNLPGVIAGRWFGAEERDLATTIGTLSNILGQAIGQAIAPICVKENDEDKNVGHQTDGFTLLLGWQLGLSVLAFLWVFLCFRNRPPTPPSYGVVKIDRKSIFKKWRALLQNRDFNILLFVFGVGLALFNSIVTLLDQFLSPCGYNSDDSGNIGAALVGSGIVGAAIVGTAMDSLHWYRTTLKSTIVISVFVIVIVCYVLQRDNKTLVYVVFSVLGACTIAVLPVSIENALECTYPCSEEISVGLLFLVGNVLSIGFTSGIQGLLDLQGTNECGGFFAPARIFMMVIGVVLAVSVLLYQGQYKRLEDEQRHRKAIERMETDITSLSWSAVGGGGGVLDEGVSPSGSDYGLLSN